MSRRALLKAGKRVSQIPVSISYRIIDLFSAGLYSSPNKALEELVSNSYDALARNVEVVIPANLHSSDTVIFVLDDGTSMNVNDFVDLWAIASSKKRQPGRESQKRPPIGKFGIGKLATYVLARELTYVTKVARKYQAVTMDFSKIDPDAKSSETTLLLDVRRLTEAEARQALATLAGRKGKGAEALPLFGQRAPAKWTIAAMSNLTGLAQSLEIGRLRWVLSTALPLNPQFNLYFNGTPLEPAKAQTKPLKTWRIGDKDSAVKQLHKEKIEIEKTKDGVDISGVGSISGYSEIYADPLDTGKSQKWGRSNGVFVNVRGRLINLDDGLFGLPALSHGPFSRWRMEVQADGLDAVLRSTREAVLESPGVKALRAYILHKFNEARTWYNQWLAEVDATTRVSSRIAQTSTSLSRRPLFNAIRDAIESGKSTLFLTRVPSDLTKGEADALLSELENEIDSPDLFISDVQFDALGPQFGIALFDVKSRCIRVNTLHPFFANYAEHYKNPEPFVLLAATEVLTEGFLHEQQVDAAAARVVLEKRDRFLRELVYSRPLAAPVVAQMLEESASTPGEFEDAVYRGFLTLGFDVTKIGGKGEPDGVGNAPLGIRDGADASYTFTYDAKSTSALRVKAHTVGTATITRHREKYKAHYAIVVAPDFEGGDSLDAAIIYEATTARITLMPVMEFSRLILLASTRQFELAKLRDLLDTCHTPSEVRDWIRKQLAEDAPEWPLPEILRTVNELQREGVEVVRFGAIRVQSPKLRKYREREIEGWISSAAMLAGGYISVVGDVVTLDAPPEKILSEIRRASDNLPAQFRPEAMIDQLAKAKSRPAARRKAKS